MANRCSNKLYFTGSEAKVKAVNLFMAEQAARCATSGGCYIEGTDGYFGDLMIGKGRFLFDTSWEPDIPTVMAIANRFKVGFVLDYQDSAMSLYGQARYHHDQLRDTRLNSSDFAEVSAGKQEDTYQYRGQLFTDDEVLALYLLKAKIKQEDAGLSHRQSQRPTR